MLIHKDYNSYKEYIKHQRAKTDIPSFRQWLNDNVQARYSRFLVRLKPLKNIIQGVKILCLGARFGEEVRALHKLGFTETVGIDLNPGDDNKYVIKGDFHDLSFPDDSFDGIYTNCLDHAYDLRKISVEAHRVLRPGGILAIGITFLDWDRAKCEKHFRKKDKHECLLWESADDVVVEFKEFNEVRRFPDPSDNNWMFIILKKEE